MKKDILKNVLILILCSVIVFLLINKKKYKFVSVENQKQKICQRCLLIDNKYYCETFGVKESESDK